MDTLTTIAPVFIIIFLGWYARKKAFIPYEFLGPANRLIYFFAIPALIFRSVSGASLESDFHFGVLFLTLLAAALIYGGTWIACLVLKLPPVRSGAIIQSAAHGNLGYIGLPFAFYFLGIGGLAKASILTAFLAILQNVLSVSALSTFSPHEGRGLIKGVLSKLSRNPVILSSIAGIIFSGLGLSLPLIAQKTFDMLAGMAPPMALLLIGGTLSFSSFKLNFRPAMIATFVKLVVLPFVGLVLYLTFGIPSVHFLPGLILLACPTATISYVLAKEMKGDPDFVAATVSGSTLLSALTFLLWMGVVATWLK